MNLQEKIVSWMKAEKRPVTFKEICDYHCDRLAGDIYDVMVILLEKKKISRVKINTKDSGYELTLQA